MLVGCDTKTGEKDGQMVTICTTHGTEAPNAAALHTRCIYAMLDGDRQRRREVGELPDYTDDENYNEDRDDALVTLAWHA